MISFKVKSIQQMQLLKIYFFISEMIYTEYRIYVSLYVDWNVHQLTVHDMSPAKKNKDIIVVWATKISKTFIHGNTMERGVTSGPLWDFQNSFLAGWPLKCHLKKVMKWKTVWAKKYFLAFASVLDFLMSRLVAGDDKGHFWGDAN